MPVRIAVVAIDAQEPARVADFWAVALGWEAYPDSSGGGGISLAPAGMRDESGLGGLMIDVCPVPEGKAVKNRLHLDLRADDATQAEEVERLLALGATRADVGQGQDASWVVLADPEGDEFCVLQRSVQEVEAAQSHDAVSPVAGLASSGL